MQMQNGAAVLESANQVATASARPSRLPAFLVPVARASYAYFLLACCLGLTSLPGAAALLLGAANLRHDPWYREWQLWLLLVVALLLRLGRL